MTAARPRGGRGCSPSAPPALAELGDLEAAAAGSATAMTAAAAAGDPAAELDAIRARVAALSAPRHRAERLRLGAREVELAGSPRLASRWPRCSAGCGGSMLAYQLLASSRRWTRRLPSSRSWPNRPGCRWPAGTCFASRPLRAALAGQLALARDRSAQTRRLVFRIQDPSGAGLVVDIRRSRSRSSAVTPGRSPRTSSTSPRPVRRFRSSGPHWRALFVVGRTDEAEAVTRPSASCQPPGTRASGPSAHSPS